MTETSKPFVIVDGKRYVLDGNTSAENNHSDSLPEPEIFQQLTPPPRNVSLVVQILLMLNSGYSFLGWFLACFGMIFCIFFIPPATNTAVDLLRHYEPLGQGEITAVEKTNLKLNDTRVYLFTFKQPNGTTGKCRITGERYKIGDKVELEKSGNKIRIAGNEMNMMNLVAVMICLFPIVGLYSIPFENRFFDKMKVIGDECAQVLRILFLTTKKVSA
jgi:hypothetical protein